MCKKKRVTVTAQFLKAVNNSDEDTKFQLEQNLLGESDKFLVFKLSGKNSKIFDELDLRQNTFCHNTFVEIVIIKDKDWPRQLLNVLGTIASITFAVVSILIGTDIICVSDKKAWGNIIVAAWVILPPVFFWIDWLWSRHIDDDTTLTKIMHNHDLARNIWLGLVVLLVALFKIEWEILPGTG